MKKIMILAISILFLAACTKESMQDNSIKSEDLSAKNSSKQKSRVTRPITDVLESDPDPNAPPLSCSEPGVVIGGGVLFYGNMSHLGKVYGKGVNKSCSLISATQIAITSDEITYAANGDEIWTTGNIVLNLPPAGSTIATITGGSKIVGGTGRFAGATGYFIYENMVVDLATGHESHTAYGEITY